MVAAQWGDHCGRGRRGDYISDSAGQPRRRLQAASQERSTLGCIHRTNTDWQRRVGGLAVMRAAPDLLSVMHWLTLWVRAAKWSFFLWSRWKKRADFQGPKRLSWLASVYQLASILHKINSKLFFFLCTARQQQDVGGQARMPDSLSSWKRLITCFLKCRDCTSVRRSRFHFPTGLRASDQSCTYLFRRGRRHC